MSEFKKYKRTNDAEMRPVTNAEILRYHNSNLRQWILDVDAISVSVEDQRNESPKFGDMIARNPNNLAADNS